MSCSRYECDGRYYSILEYRRAPGRREGDLLSRREILDVNDELDAVANPPKDQQVQAVRMRCSECWPESESVAGDAQDEKQERPGDASRPWYADK